ncbi:MAG: hypothetical protein WDZ82_00965 [Candidatus Paceibacterota bacterium]
MQNQSQKQQIIIAVVMLLIGFLIGVLITAGWYQGNDGTSNDIDTTDDTEQVMEDDTDDTSGEEDNDLPDRSSLNNNSSSNTSGSEDVSVSANDQSAGNEVVVSNVEVDRTTWVAVREGVNGSMGNVLGAKRVEQGSHSDLTIRLLRGTEAGGTYFVTLYEDNGDGEFSHISDSLVEVDGSTVFSTFEASAE